MFKTRGGGVKGRLNNVKKNALLVFDGFPFMQRWEDWGINGWQAFLGNVKNLFHSIDKIWKDGGK